MLNSNEVIQPYEFTKDLLWVTFAHELSTFVDRMKAEFIDLSKLR